MKNYIVAVTLGIGSLAIPFIASAQSYGYGPSSVINAWTAGIPLVTYGFGNGYGAPASAYMGYQDNYYGGYGGGPSYYAPATYQPGSYYGQGNYGQGNYGQGNYGQRGSQGYYPNTSYLNWVPQNYQYQPYYGGYSQAYMPNYYGSNIGGNYWGNYGY